MKVYKCRGKVLLYPPDTAGAELQRPEEYERKRRRGSSVGVPSLAMRHNVAEMRTNAAVPEYWEINVGRLEAFTSKLEMTDKEASKSVSLNRQSARNARNAWHEMIYLSMDHPSPNQFSVNITSPISQFSNLPSLISQFFPISHLPPGR